MNTIDLDDETTLNTINGKTLFTGRNTPNGRQFLIVNGMMTITPDAGDALRQYMGLLINGMVYCPDSLATVLASKAMMNGKVETYPDGAVVLKNNAVIDRAFALRAEEGRLYWADKRLIAVDSDLDGAALAAKGVRFSTQEAYLSESLAEDLAPLFDADTRLVILPDGTAVEQDDLTLSGVSLRRFGDSLLVLGDLRLTEDCAEPLSNLEYLQVEGDVYLPESLADALGRHPRHHSGRRGALSARQAPLRQDGADGGQGPAGRLPRWADPGGLQKCHPGRQSDPRRRAGPSGLLQLQEHLLPRRAAERRPRGGRRPCEHRQRRAGGRRPRGPRYPAHRSHELHPVNTKWPCPLRGKAVL